MVSFKLQFNFLVYDHGIVIVGWLRYHLLSALSRIIWAVVAWLLWSSFYLHTENKQTLHFPLLICLCTEFIGIVLEWYKKENRIKKQIRFSRSPAIFKIFLSFPVKEELYSSGLSPLPSTERSAFLFIQKNSWKRHFQSFLKVGCFGKCYVMLCAICWGWGENEEEGSRLQIAEIRGYEGGPHREMVERCGEYGEYGEYGGGGASDDNNHLPVACYLQSLSANNIYSLYICTTIVDTSQ